jgi:hypothetical protein
MDESSGPSRASEPAETDDAARHEGAEAQAAVIAAELPGNYFELYKLAVEMADRISARRGLANSFFLTANTGVVALLAGRDIRWYLAVAGIALSISWWALLKSYRDLNKAKFQTILAMEDQLPIRMYGNEWDRLQAEPVTSSRCRDLIRAWARQYRELGRVERIVPWVFTAIYVVDIVRQLGA